MGANGFGSETDSLSSKVADIILNILRCRFSPAATYTATMEEAATVINQLAEESKKEVEVSGDRGDRTDWKKAEAGNSLYKLCKSIDCSSGDFPEIYGYLFSVCICNI